MTLNHAQIAKDYKKLINKYDIPYDLTGGMVIEEVLMKAVEKGTKAACAKAILSIIKYGFQCSNNTTYRYQSDGHYEEVSINDCSFIRYIAETYLA